MSLTSRKRARPIFSCLECKRKKLKCDRQQPCHQCSRLGRSTRCRYAEEDEQEELSDTNLNDSVSSIADLAKRVAALEEWKATAGRGGVPNGNNTSVSSSSSVSQAKHSSSLHRKGDSVRFRSRHHWSVLQAEFDDVARVLQSIATDPLMKGIRGDLQQMVTTFSYSKDVYGAPEPVQRMSNPLETMRHLLPDPGKCVDLLTLYEKSHASIFVPFQSFGLSEEAMVRDATENGQHLPVLIGLLVAAISMIDAMELDPGRRSTLKSMCSCLDVWLGSLTGKRRLKYSFIQINLLNLQAYYVQGEHADLLWEKTALLIRRAMNMGLQEDLDDLEPAEKALRKHLWWAVKEWDLQISLDCGMPDSCGDHGRVEIAPVGPYATLSTHETGNAAFAALANTYNLRRQLWAILNQPAESLDRRDIWNKVETVMFQALAEKEHWQSLRETRSKNPERHAISKVLISMCTYVYLTRVVSYACCRLSFNAQDAENTSLAFRTLLSSIAIDLLNALQSLKDLCSAPQAEEDTYYWHWFHENFKQDVIRAVFYLCLDLRTSKNKNGTATTRRSRHDEPSFHNAIRIRDEVIAMPSRETISTLIEITLSDTLCRLKDASKNFKTFVWLSIAHESAISDACSDAEQDALLKQRAVDAVRMAKSHLEGLSSAGGGAMGTTGSDQAPSSAEFSRPNMASRVAAVDPDMNQFSEEGLDLADIDLDLEPFWFMDY